MTGKTGGILTNGRLFPGKHRRYPVHRQLIKRAPKRLRRQRLIHQLNLLRRSRNTLRERGSALHQRTLHLGQHLRRQLTAVCLHQRAQILLLRETRHHLLELQGRRICTRLKLRQQRDVVRITFSNRQMILQLPHGRKISKQNRDLLQARLLVPEHIPRKRKSHSVRRESIHPSPEHRRLRTQCCLILRHIPRELRRLRQRSQQQGTESILLLHVTRKLTPLHGLPTCRHIPPETNRQAAQTPVDTPLLLRRQRGSRVLPRGESRQEFLQRTRLSGERIQFLTCQGQGTAQRRVEHLVRRGIRRSQHCRQTYPIIRRHARTHLRLRPASHRMQAHRHTHAPQAEQPCGTTEDHPTHPTSASQAQSMAQRPAIITQSGLLPRHAVQPLTQFLLRHRTQAGSILPKSRQLLRQQPGRLPLQTRPTLGGGLRGLQRLPALQASQLRRRLGVPRECLQALLEQGPHPLPILCQGKALQLPAPPVQRLVLHFS